MSAKLLGTAFAADIKPHAYKLVLLKLVDAARDDGAKIFPSVATIARAAGVSDRHTKRVLAGFVTSGLLHVVSRGGNGPKDTTEYKLDLTMLDRLADGHQIEFVDGKGTLAAKGDMAAHSEKGDTDGALRVTPEAEKGDTRTTQSLRPLSDPLVERDARVGRGVRFQAPDDTEASERFDKLVAIYPPGSIGDVNAARKAFVGLSIADQEAAIEAWPRVRSGMRREGRDHVFSVRTYLGNRDWERFPKPISATGTVEDRVTFLPFSRAAWALFRKTYEGKKSLEFVLRWLRNGAAVPLATFPGEEEQAALVAVEVGSPQQIAWRDHCKRLGFTLPIPDQTEWIFLPSAMPPPIKLGWKTCHLPDPVLIEVRGPEWWWRFYQEGVPHKALQEALDDRSAGNLKVTMGPLPLPSEASAMIRIDYAHPAFHAWDFWFASKGCKTLGALTGPIYVPCENPALMRGRGTDTDEDVTRIDAEVEEVV